MPDDDFTPALIDLAKLGAITNREKALVAQAREACWNEINAWIKKGPLPEPAHSERNGMVLACNIIRQQLKPTTV